MDWLSIAQNLPMNQKERTDCECGSGKTLVINHYPKSYNAHCFSCTFNEFEFKGKQTLAELARIKQLNETAEAYNGTIKLPEDISEDIPLAGRLLLYRAGLTPDKWKEYGIGYSESYGRIVLPVYDTSGRLIWLQQRALLKGQKPKYLQPSYGRDNIIFRGHRSPDTLQEAVVVEDIFSAIRVANVCDTFSLLGTKLSPPQATTLSRYKKITIWLDGDKAGRAGAYNIRKSLGLVTDVRNIRTDLDPKLYSNEQIKEILDGHT